VYVGPSFVADEQSLEVVHPRESALDHPAIAAEPRAVLGVAAGDDRSNPSLTQQAPLVVRVVAAISDERVWSTARSPDSATHRRHCPHERDELLDVVSVGTRQASGERDARRIDDQVLLLGRALQTLAFGGPMCRSSGGSTRGAASRRRAAGWVPPGSTCCERWEPNRGVALLPMSTSQQTKTARPARGTFDN
jgi:hypothetical protein